MKRIISLFIFLLVSLSLVACDKEHKDVLRSIGSYTLEGSYTEGEFQDCTDYEKYSYEEVDFSDNAYFNKLDHASEKALREHIGNFENWVALTAENHPDSELAKNYDFDPDMISAADYVYIYDDPDYSAFGNYDVYFFDMETMTLYFFHNNI